LGNLSKRLPDKLVMSRTLFCGEAEPCRGDSSFLFSRFFECLPTHYLWEGITWEGVDEFCCSSSFRASFLPYSTEQT
jgi:hypothetical protein